MNKILGAGFNSNKVGAYCQVKPDTLCLHFDFENVTLPKCQSMKGLRSISKFHLTKLGITSAIPARIQP